jgi:hypothetical protein
VASDGERVTDELRAAFGWPAPFNDPGVATFGLTNSVLTVGDTFIEVVAPREPGTTAGRYLARRGGDGGYMAIFQVPDLAAARRRLAAWGVTPVWSIDLPDMATTHLHPRDAPGAIVSLDWADPPESWRWAGPAWTGGAPATRAPGGITSITVAVDDPADAAERWAAALGLTATPLADGAELVLAAAGQRVHFVRAATSTQVGITAVAIASLGTDAPRSIGGVSFTREERP